MSQNFKRDAAIAALDLVKDGMKLGLGSGSTAEEFVKVLAPRVADGLDIIGIPTSKRTGELATELGIKISTLEDHPLLDLTIDGADEIDPQMRLIKGGGAAHLREKIVATSSKAMAVIADHSKLVDTLGAYPLPLEVVPFGLNATKNMIESICRLDFGMTGALELRMRDGAPLVTDNGNLVLDASFGRIEDPEHLAVALSQVPGLVEHGLFINIATIAFVAGPDGVTVLQRANDKN
ncbi:MAG: ribose-5-phosphate isomerase RpiA [Rhizobiales bacterium]|nr:ribose-5-phosphate isomerase RpiA [Hyphomicrobiales bacterium]